MKNKLITLLGLISILSSGCETYDDIQSSTTSSTARSRDGFFSKHRRIPLSTGYKPYNRGLGQLGKGGYSETWLQNNIAKVRYDGNDKVYNEEASDYCLLRCAEVTKEKGFRYFTIIEQSNQPRSSSEPSSIRIIRVANEQPQNGPIAYEVDFLIKSLKEKYNLD